MNSTKTCRLSELKPVFHTVPQVYWVVSVSHLFDVEEVLGIKGDTSPGHRDVFIQSTAVADIGPHSKGHCFSL